MAMPGLCYNAMTARNAGWHKSQARTKAKTAVRVGRRP